MQLEIHNFQSIANTKLNLSGFTVIEGKSNSGKSATRRALDSLLFNNWDKSYAKNNTRETKVRLTYDNTEIVMTKTPDLNRFSLKQGDSPIKSVDKAGSGQPEFLSNIGYGLLDTEKEQINLTITTQLEPLFMVSYPDVVNTRILNRVFDIEHYEKAQRLANSELRDIKSKVGLYEEEFSSLKTKELDLQKDYYKTEELYSILSEIDLKLQMNKKLRGCYDSSNKAEIALSGVSKLYLEIDRVIHKLSVTQNYLELYKSNKITISSLNRAKLLSMAMVKYNQYLNLSAYRDKTDKQTKTRKTLLRISKFINSYNSFKKNLDTVQGFLSLNETYSKYQSRISKYKIYDKLYIIHDAVKSIDSLLSLNISLLNTKKSLLSSNKRADALALYERYIRVNKAITSLSCNTKTSDMLLEINNSISLVNKELAEFKTCPLCGSSDIHLH